MRESSKGVLGVAPSDHCDVDLRAWEVGTSGFAWWMRYVVKCLLSDSGLSKIRELVVDILHGLE